MPKGKIPAKLKRALRDAMETIFPPAMSALLQEVSSAEPDFNRMAKIIATDPALTTTILSLVNSPYYGFSEQVQSLKRATVLLGTKEILKIALSVTFQKNLEGKFEYCDVLTYNTWRQIIWGAVSSEILAQYLSPSETESVYLASLLKDLSLLIICCLKDDEVKSFVDICYERENLISLKQGQLERERKIWGVTHPEISLALLKSWDFPLNEIMLGIAKHHDYEHLEEHSPKVQAIILGTLWAEAEFENSVTSGLFKFREMLRLILHIDDKEFIQIRHKVQTNFASLCKTLGFEAENQSNKLYFYSLPIEKIQNFYHLLHEIDIAKDAAEVARIVARHLFWLWKIKDFCLALISPITGNFIVFEFKDGRIEEIKEEEYINAVCQSSKEQCFHLDFKTENIFLGCICLREEDFSDKEGLQLYCSLFIQNYKKFYFHYLEEKSKALVLDLLPVGIVRLDKKGAILQVNDFAQNILHLKTEASGLYFDNVVKKMFGIELGDSWQDFLQKKISSFTRLYCPLAPEDSLEGKPCFNLSAYWRVLEGTEQILVILQDIQEILNLKSEIVYQQKFLKALISSMHDLVFTVDYSARILFTSPSLEQLKNKNFFAISSPCSNLGLNWGPEVLQKENTPLEIRLFITEQEHKLLEILISSIKGNQHYLIVGRDLGKIKRLEAKIRDQAVFDHLSRVFNRHQFALFLEREIKKAKRCGTSLGIIFFDLDKFKQYNDTYGHQQGDEVIRSFGLILNKYSRQGMDFPCRYGGDEFVLLVTSISKQGLETLARRIKNHFNKLYKDKISLSIGLTMLKPEDTEKTFLARADEAVYIAKRAGGNDMVWK
ncbi:MAG: GGDEF domain-containing protein [Desulfonauticus sp.]|nr:GGDEF domain-containing protein [Desulfonauticus sp.]